MALTLSAVFVFLGKLNKKNDTAQLWSARGGIKNIRT